MLARPRISRGFHSMVFAGSKKMNGINQCSRCRERISNLPGNHNALRSQADSVATSFCNRGRREDDGDLLATRLHRTH